ncbi:zinc ribbon domain-containing protein [Methanoculleus sp.]|uniref:zinc ribbon domain-containing protein n=1 Tax=Methanoculleus sp. TaxID=90427 RepID=UPI001BD4DBF2|nr:zinc ribbon domain-containing protein [Methanoculleus sp.]
MDYTESSLTGDERRDTGKALVHYKRDVVQAIREVFDAAEAPAPVPPTCSNCGAALGEGARFCTRCGMPQTTEAAADLLGEVFAKELGRNPYDPRFREALARIRKEMQEEWDALVQRLTVPVKA